MLEREEVRELLLSRSDLGRACSVSIILVELERLLRDKGGGRWREDSALGDGTGELVSTSISGDEGTGGRTVKGGGLAFVRCVEWGRGTKPNETLVAGAEGGTSGNSF